MEGEFIIKKSRFLEEEEYQREVRTTTNNLLIDLLKRVGITSADLHNLSFIHRYNVGKDTLLHENDFTRSLVVYRAYGIKILDIETTREHTRLLIPIKEVDYTKEIRSPGELNYIPSTIAFIRDFNPNSGYKEEAS